MIAAVSVPRRYIPNAMARPTAAVDQTVAAVVKPVTLPCSRIITPAPKKPTPDTTWPAILVSTPLVPRADVDPELKTKSLES